MPSVVLESYQHRFNLDGLLGSLPVHITSITLDVYGILNLKQLRKLTHLTTLTSLNGCEIWGMKRISGLTRLDCYSPPGRLARLAPTLRHLKVYDYEHLRDMQQLTRLEIFKTIRPLPPDFLQTHSQLPLKHLSIKTGYYSPLVSGSAPMTLTRLTVNGAYDLPPGVPTSITHLQLVYAYKENIEQAAKALPCLRSFDMHLYESLDSLSTWTNAFASLTKFTDLESLGICVEDRQAPGTEYFSRWQVLASLPELTTAITKGVQLKVIENQDDFEDSFWYPYFDMSVWANP